MNSQLLRKAGTASLAAAAIGQLVEWVVWLVTQARINRFDMYDYSLAGDSPVFQAAAKTLRDAPDLLYHRPTISDAIASIPGSPEQAFNTIYVSPPATAVPFLPIADWSQLAAWILVATLSTTVLIVGLRHLGASWQWIALVTLFAPVVMGFRLGQLAMIGAALLAFAGAAIRDDRRFLAGLLVGLLIIKPQYAVGIAMAWLIEPKDRARELAGAITSSTVVLGLTALIWPAAWQSFVADAAGLAASVNNVGLLVHRFAITSSVSLLAGDGAATVITLIAVAAMAFGWRRVTVGLDPLLKYALAIPAGLLVSPYVVDYDWTLLVVPALILWTHRPDLRDTLLPGFGVIAITAMMSRAIAAGTYDVIGDERALQLAPWVLLAVTVAVVRRMQPHHGTAVAGLAEGTPAQPSV